MLPHKPHPFLAMTPPGSKGAWHMSFSGTAPAGNQQMDCTAVPSARLAKVPERILHVAPLGFPSLNALLPNPYN